MAEVSVVVVYEKDRHHCVNEVHSHGGTALQGPSRLRSTDGGAFLTTKVPVIDAALTIESITTCSSYYDKTAGSFTQARLIRGL